MIVCTKEVKALQIISAGVPWKCHGTHPKSDAESTTFMLFKQMLHAVINSRTDVIEKMQDQHGCQPNASRKTPGCGSITGSRAKQVARLIQYCDKCIFGSEESGKYSFKRNETDFKQMAKKPFG